MTTMTLVTKDGTKAGKTTYPSGVSIWDEETEQPVHVWSGELPTIEAALEETKARMTKRGGVCFGSIMKGTYQLFEFDDERHGHVRDASWCEDGHQWDLYITETGIDVDESEW